MGDSNNLYQGCGLLASSRAMFDGIKAILLRAMDVWLAVELCPSHTN
jgi:hypothetical protein